MPASLPLPPSPLPDGRLIPRLIWVAVKDVKDELPAHLQKFLERNPLWDKKICDNECKELFINSTFSGTSIEWAFNIINPQLGAARADIWRYAVLFTFGGLYLDDDSDIRTPLEEIVKPNNHMIMSEEGPSSLGHCYLPSYHLSDAATLARFPNFSQATYFYSYNNETEAPLFFHGNTLVNWGIFVKPRHPLIHRTLSNIIDILKWEYIRQPVILMSRWDVKWKMVMCSTNFVMTLTLREMLLEAGRDATPLSTGWLPEIHSNNFASWGGRVKAIWTGGDPNHYMKAMQKRNLHLLREYGHISLEDNIRYLEGRAVMGDAGKEVFWINNGTRRQFGSYDTLVSMKLDSQIKYVKDSVLLAIPIGLPVPKDMKPQPQHSPQTHALMTSSSSSSSSSSSNSVPALSSSSSSLTVDDKFLSSIQALVDRNDSKIQCFGDDYAGARDDLINGEWKDIIQSHPVMIYPQCLRLFQLGNTLGYFFNDLACADVSGSHFIAAHKHFDVSNPTGIADGLETTGEARLAFFHALPDRITHQSPLSLEEVKQKMKKECNCLQYCWENKEAAWLKRVPLIAGIMNKAIDAYIAAATKENLSKQKGTTEQNFNNNVLATKLSNVTDLWQVPGIVKCKPDKSNGNTCFNEHPFLPLIPDVAIQYRCGDNVGFGKTRYGLLPFHAFNSRVPISSKHIYVIADSPTRSAAHPFSSRCGIILEALFKHLVDAFPQAVVVVKRGGDQFLDIARLAKANITICSASTFCLWPALSKLGNDQHQHQHAYFPLTPLVAGAISNTTAPALAPHFHWIADVEMIKDFKQFRPWTKVIDKLKEVAPSSLR